MPAGVQVFQCLLLYSILLAMGNPTVIYYSTVCLIPKTSTIPNCLA
jgi:hypothetical protein